jgi:hypothetical protein
VAGQNPTEPPHSTSYTSTPVPDEPAIAAHRARLASLGLHPFSLPLAVDVDRWLQQAPTPWDSFPDTHTGKFDAETAPLPSARVGEGLKPTRVGGSSAWHRMTH